MINIDNVTNWYKTIIFSPNATGKSTISKQLYEKNVKKRNTEIMTAKTINNLIDLNNVGIHVGKEAKKLGENEKLSKTINEINYLKNTIFKDYNVTSATKLRNASLYFNSLNIKNDRLVSFIENEKLNLDIQSSYLTYDEAIELDQIFSIEEMNLIKEVKFNNDLYTLLSKYDISKKHTISKEKHDVLNILKNMINQTETVCPLCGNDFAENNKLRNAINSHFAKYSTDEYQSIIDIFNQTWSKISNLSNTQILQKYNINFSCDNTLENKVIEILKLNNLLNDIKAAITNKINHDLNKIKIYTSIQTYRKNLEDIKVEEERITNQELYYQDIILNFEKLVTLPKTLEIEIKHHKLQITDIKSKNIYNPSECLSESEVKRLALAVLKAQIKYAEIEYIIFDDPIDSYDDYYLKKACKYIALIIKENPNLKWTIFSHIFELTHILSKEFKTKYKYLYYVHQPDYKYKENSKPLLYNFYLTHNEINDITQHELVLFNNILSSIKRHKMDTDFALLCAANTTRNAINDILKLFKITYVKSKVKNKITNMENRHIHYSDRNKYYMHNFISLYKRTYKNYNLQPLKNCNEDSIIARERILSTKYNDINADNELLKAILYNILRVSNCKYLMEKKLMEELTKCNLSSNDIEKIFETKSLGNKIIEVFKLRDKCTNFEKIEQINIIHEEFSTLINDFSHATVRMFPPYLSISSYDIAKLENQILKL